MQLCSIGTRRRQFNDDPEEQPEAIGGDGASSRSCAPPVKKVMKSYLKTGKIGNVKLGCSDSRSFTAVC